MAKATRAHIKANNKYNEKTYDSLRLIYKKPERLRELIELAIAKTGESKVAYIIRAIRAQLAQDGITIDMLPPLEEQEKTASERSLRHYIGYEVLYYYFNPNEEDEFFRHWLESQFLTVTLEEAREKAHKFYSKLKDNIKQNSKYYIRGWNIEAHNKAEAESILKKMIEDSNDDEVEFEMPEPVYNEEVIE